MVTPAADAVPTAAVRSNRRFFLSMAIVMLTVVVVGFAPTLYLRALFDAPPINARLYLHGIVLTTWFVWLVVQTSLIRAGRRADHRKLGVAGVVIGVLTAATALDVTLNVVPRILSFGLDLDSDISAIGIAGLGSGMSIAAFVTPIVWGNLLGAVGFLALLMAAVLLRRNVEAHKRLMLVASISILAPALARVSRWPILGGEQGPFIPLALVALLAALVVYDLVQRRRLHSATLFGAAFAILCGVLGRMIANSDFGQAFVRGLGAG